MFLLLFAAVCKWLPVRCAFFVYTVTVVLQFAYLALQRESVQETHLFDWKQWCGPGLSLNDHLLNKKKFTQVNAAFHWTVANHCNSSTNSDFFKIKTANSSWFQPPKGPAHTGPNQALAAPVCWMNQGCHFWEKYWVISSYISCTVWP